MWEKYTRGHQRKKHRAPRRIPCKGPTDPALPGTCRGRSTCELEGGKAKGETANGRPPFKPKKENAAIIAHGEIVLGAVLFPLIITIQVCIVW